MEGKALVDEAFRATGALGRMTERSLWGASTSVVNIHAGQEFDVFIGRPSCWGNPYVIGVHGDRKRVVELYRRHVRRSPELLAKLGELRGKRLGCYCAPLACHGDVLVELVEGRDGKG